MCPAAKKDAYSRIYHASYLPYLLAVLFLSSQYGLTPFFALHQDVWPRYAGRFGAPAYTLERIFFDLTPLLLSSLSSALCWCPATSMEAKQLNSEAIPIASAPRQGYFLGHRRRTQCSSIPMNSYRKTENSRTKLFSRILWLGCSDSHVPLAVPIRPNVCTDRSTLATITRSQCSHTRSGLSQISNTVRFSHLPPPSSLSCPV